MFKELKEVNTRPAPFEFYTADELWTNEHTAKQMLAFHLNESIDVSSRNKDFIEPSVEWISSYFNVDENIAIADFGCGPGLYASRLAERGAEVTGIDFSGNSLAYSTQEAKKKGLEINYIQANYLDFKTDQMYDLIIMIMCDFCALSPNQRKTLLSKFKSVLSPEGSVLLDVYSLNAYNKKKEAATYELNQFNGLWSPDDYYAFVNTFKYEEDKVILDKFTIVEEFRKRVVYNWLQYFSKEALVNEFEENGFSIEAIFSDVAGKPFSTDSGEMAIVAKEK